MKTWSNGKLKDKVKKDVLEFLSGDDILLDKELVKWDILTTIAHEIALHKAGVLKGQELKVILENLIDFYESGIELDVDLEDVHSNIEIQLMKKLGKVGEKIHTAVSRNEQVITDTKLYMKNEILEISMKLLQLCKTIISIAEQHKDSVMPGYTHHQHAMPYTFGSYLMAHFYSFIDDLKLLQDAYDLIDKCPMGSGAGYGIPMKINKEMTAKLLGFKSVQQNSLYSINSRGKNESVVISAVVQIAMDLNKISEDLILFSTKEFGFIDLPDEYCTGSSIMPNKKNPDVLELVKGKSSTIIANLFQMFLVMKNLPSGYNRDTQEVKHPTLNSLKLIKECIEMIDGVVKNMKVNEKMKDLDNEIFSTHHALSMVKDGKPYKEAFKTVGKMVKSGENIPTFTIKPELGEYSDIIKEKESELTRLKSDFDTSVKNLIEFAKNISKDI
jgi:argininosuccinate lyase